MAILERRKKDGSISYQVRVKDLNGEWFEACTFHDPVDAQLEEARLLDKRRKGAKAAFHDARRYTLDEYWEVWKEENRSESSAGYKITQDQMYKDYVKPFLGETKLIDIGIPEIGKVMNHIQKLGRAPDTRKHLYTLLHKMFEDAIEYYQMLATNPVKKKFHRPKVFVKKRRFLKPSDAWTLLNYVRDEGELLGPAIWIQTLAALRVEAVQGLKWDSVFWELDQILIRRAWKQKTRTMEEFDKSGEWEYVPMIPALKAHLWLLWEKSSQDLSEFVCQSRTGGMLPYTTYYKRLAKICKRAGVEEVTTHELRHSATEIWIQAGASREDIRRLLNHSKDSTATDRYIHRTPERLHSIGQSIVPETKPEQTRSFTKGYTFVKTQAYTPSLKRGNNVH